MKRLNIRKEMINYLLFFVLLCFILGEYSSSYDDDENLFVDVEDKSLSKEDQNTDAPISPSIDRSEDELMTTESTKIVSFTEIYFRLIDKIQHAND